ARVLGAHLGATTRARQWWRARVGCRAVGGCGVGVGAGRRHARWLLRALLRARLPHQRPRRQRRSPVHGGGAAAAGHGAGGAPCQRPCTSGRRLRPGRLEPADSGGGRHHRPGCGTRARTPADAADRRRPSCQPTARTL
ncbi:MAG: hypothetical protein AVDCRST_MAG29-2002, partial [uncultured Nocardioidaceae bacterium]